MTEKKQAKKQTILHTIMCGEIIAEIHLHSSNTGFQYHSYRLQRVIGKNSVRRIRGATFFAQNAEQIAQAAHAAAEWIKARQQAETQDHAEDHEKGDLP